MMTETGEIYIPPPPECVRCGKDILDDDFMRNSLGDILCWECYGKLIDTAEARREGER